MKGVNKKTRLIIIALILIECFSIFLTYKSFENKKINEQINKYELSSNTFAIFIEKDSGNYEEQVDSSMGWPDSTDYSLNPVKSYCVDNNENKISGILSYDSASQTAIVKTNKTVFCYLYFNKISKGIEIDINGGFPDNYHFTKTLACNGTASATWNYMNNSMIVNSVSSKNAKCELSYNSAGSTNKLSDKIKSLNNTTGYCTNSSYTTKESCESAGYSWWGVFNQQVAVASSSASWNKIKCGTNTEVVTMSPANSFRCGNALAPNRYILEDDLSSGAYSFKITTPGYYRIYYYLPHTEDIVMPNPNIMELLGVFESKNYNTTDNKTGSFDIGYVNANETVSISFTAGYDYSIFNPYFIIESTSDFTKYNTGYRFAGADPNNYIWFNNELWRIIGYVPIPGNGSEWGIKIIKNEEMSNYFSTSGSNGSYLSSNLNCFLNRNYYNKTNGDIDNYCSKTGDITRWNFSYYGIDEHYRGMIKSALWSDIDNTFSHSSTYAADYKNDEYLGQGFPTRFYYTRELAVGSRRNVGLKNQGDVQLASYPNNNITENVSYNNRLNWLYDSRKNDIQLNGTTSNTYVTYKPVVYLNDNIVIMSGTGTKADPYIIL